MGQAALQKFVMNVLAVGGKNRPSAEKAADDGESGFQNGQPERNHGDGDRDQWSAPSVRLGERARLT